ALSLKLALMEIIKEKNHEYPVLLLDDVLSELDEDRQKHLLEITSKYQTLITSSVITEDFKKYNIIEINNKNQ
ncbi:MAG: DNA replication and repair protein RecF, partial [Clostridia bacterium]|nr:DNA replication and repair protein RecF [Clostridia bacterium]